MERAEQVWDISKDTVFKDNKYARLEGYEEYHGKPCVCILTTRGYRLGYVGVEKDSPFYGEDELVTDFDVHAGVNTGIWDEGLDKLYAEMHGKEQADKQLYWVCFDCGHTCDALDFDSVYEHFGAEQEERLRNCFIRFNDFAQVRDTEFVMNCCHDLAKQIMDKELEMRKERKQAMER